MHVFADIRPYICTFSSCKDALHTFATRNDWAEHEFKYHLGRTLWPCSKCPMTLNNTDELQGHLYEAHLVAIDQSMLKPTITPIAELSCPLCRESLKDSKRKYISHVAKHMESISLAALPPDPEDVSDDDSNGTEKAASTSTCRFGRLSPSRSSPVDSGLYSPTQLPEIQAFDFPSLDSEDVGGRQTTFHRDSIGGLPYSSVSMTAGSSFSVFTNADNPFVSFSDNPFASFSDGPHNLASHVPVLQDFGPSTIIDSHSPTTWNENIVLESQRSSPTLLEDLFLPRLQIMTSATNSPLNYSPTLEGLSPRYVQDSPDLVDLAPYTTGDRVKRPGGPRHSKVVSDLASRQQRHQGTSETSDKSFGMVGRSSLEIDNTARDHPLYQNVTAQADGFYHCPWEGQEGCQHKPEKLKCNYEYDPFQIFSRPCPMLTTSSLASKFVDSHLKPYRCKVNACENSRFSSTACLLRHEREAHAMHGHGDKPYLCTYNDCERGVTGNGFPRHWNLRDHMKRVHNDPGTSTKSNASGSTPPPNAHARSKKRKAEANEDPYVEKASKRSVTSPVVAVQPQEPTQSAQRLLEIAKQLNDPRNASNMKLLLSAGNCIQVMAQRVTGHPAINFSKQQTG
jgi:hypothetical protein